MSGLDSLPKDKWNDSGEQPILKEDFVDIEAAIIELSGRGAAIIPTLFYNDSTSVRVKASADAPIAVSMVGFPNVLSPRYWVAFGSDGKSRENTADTDMDFDSSPTFWGNEKSSQWYAVFCIAADVDTTFTLKAMPLLRVKTQASQTISFGTSLAPGTGVGYGWTTDVLAGYQLYFLSGASIGLIREVSANNNDNSTGGTITYTGSALTVAAGDWFIALPNDVNFRWICDFFNNSSGNIQPFVKHGHRVSFTPSFPTTTIGQSAPTADFEELTAAYGAPPLGVAMYAYGNMNSSTKEIQWSGLQMYNLTTGPPDSKAAIPIVSTKIMVWGDSEGTTTFYFVYWEYPNALG